MNRAGQIWYRSHTDPRRETVIYILRSEGVMHSSISGYVLWDHDLITTGVDGTVVYRGISESIDDPFEDRPYMKRIV